MNKSIIKNFRMFPTGSYNYEMSEIESEEDVNQFSKELSKLWVKANDNRGRLGIKM